MKPGEPFRREPGKVLRVSVLGYEKVELLRHAIDQMRIREVSEGEVIRTLRNPSFPVQEAREGRKLACWNKTVRSQIKVVYEELPDRIRVITVIAKVRRLVERRRRK